MAIEAVFFFTSVSQNNYTSEAKAVFKKMSGNSEKIVERNNEKLVFLASPVYREVEKQLLRELLFGPVW